MKLILVIGVTGFSLILGWIGIALIKKDMKWEKICCISLTAISWVLAVLLIYFPEMPGPTDLMDWIYRPLTRILE